MYLSNPIYLIIVVKRYLLWYTLLNVIYETYEEVRHLALTVNNISKSFGDKKAVDNLSFEISRPGVFGLLGTNGAGKTTTIRMILGIMEKDQGEVSWNGLPVNRNTVKFGYMPESSH